MIMDFPHWFEERIPKKIGRKIEYHAVEMTLQKYKFHFVDPAMKNKKNGKNQSKV